MSPTLTLIGMILPSIIAILIIYINNHFWIKQKLFEEKNVKVQEIREVISNLLLIWKEITRLQYNINPNDPYNEIIFRDPKLLRHYLQIDNVLINTLTKSYNESITKIRKYDISTFYKLEVSFNKYNASLDDILNPILDNKELNINHKYELSYPVISDTIEELEGIILETAKHLPSKEEKSINDIIKEHKEKIEKPIEHIKIPKFMVNMVNNILPLKKAFTIDDFKTLYKDAIFQWFLRKISSTKIISKLFGGNPKDFIRQIPLLLSANMEKFNELADKIDDETALSFFTIDERESRLFRNNKDFYNLLMGIIYNIKGEVPFKFKRALAQLNSGDVNIKNEFDIIKKQILEDSTKAENDFHKDKVSI